MSLQRPTSCSLYMRARGEQLEVNNGDHTSRATKRHGVIQNNKKGITGLGNKGECRVSSAHEAKRGMIWDGAVRRAAVWRSRNGIFGCSCVRFEPSVDPHLTGPLKLDSSAGALVIRENAVVILAEDIRIVIWSGYQRVEKKLYLSTCRC